MNTQSIYNYYGSFLEVKLDNSEFYDFELSKENFNYETKYFNKTTPIEYTTIKYSEPVYSIVDKSDSIRRRTENGWTLDFIVNRDNLDWDEGSMFYYIGSTGSTDPMVYGDNNLYFEFTNDKRIKWRKIHYNYDCDPISGNTESFYTLTGQTIPLCVDNPTKDFNITITFKRYYELNDCDLDNLGGKNDLITGQTISNSIYDIINGEEPIFIQEEVLNKKWSLEKKYRLGTLKIFLNGVRIYKIDDWEEIIPSNRGDFGYAQLLKGGVDVLTDDLYESNFLFKNITYYEEPLKYLDIRHNFNIIKEIYDIENCGEECIDNFY